MRKFSPLVLLLLILILVLGITSSIAVANQEEIKIFLDGAQLSFDVNPVVENETVMIPLRSTLESLGAEVSWDQENKSVIATLGSTSFRITVHQKIAYKNGRPIILETAPHIVKDRILVPINFIGEALEVTVEWDAKNKTVYIKSQKEDLPTVGSYENLKAILEKIKDSPVTIYGGLTREEAAATAAGNRDGVGYSTTNIQVEGVDEADIAKTDGKYIYAVGYHRVVIVRAYPAEEMEVVTTLRFEEGFSPQELYVDEKYLVVIGSSGYDAPVYIQGPVRPEIYPPPYRLKTTVKAIIYDISDKENIKKLREIELEGNYISSRKVGSALYLVVNKGIHYYIMDQIEQEKEKATPSYRDTARGDNFTQIDYSEIRYFPDCPSPNYLIIAGLNLDRPGEKAHISTYLGAGENIYASQENLYVALTQYKSGEVKPPKEKYAAIAPDEANTVIYKFALNQGKVTYQGKGEVPGTVLNQFSMDEHQGYFRVATTRGHIWRNDEHASKNNIYILDQNLNVVGKLDDIAPGEKIYSVRFMGDRAYMVTFKKVDPFFVIDLKDPKTPKILGALKIPGYSDYLHPYDENHVIGFGKDTIEITPKDRQGNNLESMAFYQGMKVAIFDVSDVQHPVEMFKEVIGDRGTDSEILRNHKALLFDKDKNLLAFPVTVMEIKDKTSKETTGIPAYGQFSFQGAYVYRVDLIKGFTLKGRITHLSEENYLKAGDRWYESSKNIERILYIGDTLYTLSRSMVKAHQLDTLREIKSISIL
ncbi:MAG: inhibitor of cysteine peptidase [Clostridia bacterium]|nr:inhibitor of cysteine peptidase [Clostridia bacterium]